MDNQNQNLSSQSEPSRDDDFEWLVIRYLEGMHDEEDARKLDERLKADPACRDVFARLAIQVGVLSDPSLRPGKDKAGRSGSLKTQDIPSLIDPSPIWQASALESDGPTESWWSGHRFPIMAIAFSAFVVGAIVSWAVRPTNPEPAPLASHFVPTVTPVAYLTSSNGCAWGGASVKTWTVGHSVESGSEIALQEGIAEFRLANGVYLSIEGPSSLVLASPSALVLQYGKVTAHVPWTVTDFKVIAGVCRFTACDAEFGLSQEGNTVEAHVFSGSLQAESPQVVHQTDESDAIGAGGLVVDATGVFTKGTITAGCALSLTSEGDVLKVGDVGEKAKPEKFAVKLSMAGALPVTKSYVDAVLDSKPIGYWRFESLKGGIVSNEVSGGKDLKVVGNLRLTGSPENSVVEFQPKSNSHLISEPFNDLVDSDFTLEMWVKPSHVHLGSLLSLMWTTEDSSGATVLELQGTRRSRAIKNPPGSIRFEHHTPERGGGFGPSCFSKKPYDSRRWQHIVGVKEGSRMRLYVDGKLSATTREKTRFSTELRLLVGWMPINPEYIFVGQIDEVAIYKRALSEKEIVDHYEAVEDAIHTPSRDPVPARQVFSSPVRQDFVRGNIRENWLRASHLAKLLDSQRVQ